MRAVITANIKPAQIAADASNEAPMRRAVPLSAAGSKLPNITERRSIAAPSRPNDRGVPTLQQGAGSA
jgi:hypothetical protein